VSVTGDPKCANNGGETSRARVEAAVFVSKNEVVTEPTLAVTEYVPRALLAVAITLATPAALVTAAALDRTALAPVDGGVNVTVTPLSTWPPASLTVT
jgi:hypothetical protein